MDKYLKMADVKSLRGELVSDGVSLVMGGDRWFGDMVSEQAARAAAHAINSHDELVAANEELMIHLERCAKELAFMIDNHNEHNMEDNSWRYDHQTPWEAMQVVIKVRGCE